MTNIGRSTNFYKSRTDTTALDVDALRAELGRLQPLAELGRMAATVAHEVRNPLAGISANAELLREVLADPEDVDCVDVILGEVERLSRLVSDLLLYSRERSPTVGPMDLGQLARTVVDLCRQQADGTGVQLTASGNGLASGDEELSKQALFNIVRNAIQACRPGGEVKVVADGCCIKVCDQGQGVPEDLRERLFEPFITGRTRGLGLGAAVARRCLRRQGGSVVLEDTGPDGSRFRLGWERVADHAAVG